MSPKTSLGPNCWRNLNLKAQKMKLPLVNQTSVQERIYHISDESV